MSASRADLVSRLTVEEKVKLLAAVDWWRTPTISRGDVFVPHIKTSDGPNGARGESYVSGISAACFPCSTCVGATFDVEAARRLGEEIARETHTKSASVLLAPTMNMIRSPLGGRNYETYSEDPVLTGSLAAAFVNGCQSQGIAATPKHFVANDSEKRRTKMTSNIDEQTLREIYLLPFQIVMRDCDPWCFMTSYNKLNGEYCAESFRLLEDILRKEWGFKGVVVSDWMGTYSTALALKAGMDLEMPGPTRWRGQKLHDALDRQEITVDVLDRSVQRILDLAEKLGRFEDPEEKPEQSVLDQDRVEFIADLAAEGMVLLKNDNQVLPIAKEATVAVIGHLATHPAIGGGGSAKVLAQRIISPLQGLEDRGVKCLHAAGVPVRPTVPPVNPEGAVTLEWFNGHVVGEQKVHEATIPTPEYMIKEAWPTYLSKSYCTRMKLSIKAGSSGDHVLSVITTGSATVFVDGKEVFHRSQEPVLKPESFYFYKSKIERKFRLPMVKDQAYEVVMHSWGTEEKVLAAIEGTMFQGSSLRFMEYIDIPTSIEQAANTAAAADVAVVFVGNTNEVESEGYDRETMDLSADQYDLVSAVVKKNPKTVVVNFSGVPVTVSPFINDIPTFVQGWFAGQECGHSVAKVLLGDVNPSGKLSMSWPKRNEDNPTVGNFPCDNNDVLNYEEGLKVGYRYYDSHDAPEPQFPFGFGLSYTSFELSNLSLDHQMSTSPAETLIRISCDLVNSGELDGKQVVQIYVGPSSGSSAVQRPVKELKAFQKIPLGQGAKKRVEFSLDKYAFSTFDATAGQWKVAEGAYTVYAGFSSKDAPLSLEVVLPETHYWSGV